MILCSFRYDHPASALVKRYVARVPVAGDHVGFFDTGRQYRVVSVVLGAVETLEESDPPFSAAAVLLAEVM